VESRTSVRPGEPILDIRRSRFCILHSRSAFPSEGNRKIRLVPGGSGGKGSPGRGFDEAGFAQVDRLQIFTRHKVGPASG
jgi:hypothetical protein